jgi:hypothetical protein
MVCNVELGDGRINEDEFEFNLHTSLNKEYEFGSNSENEINLDFILIYF